MRASALITLCMLVAVAGRAGAENRPEAERYFRLGEKAYQAQEFEAAAAQFEEAYKNYELPEIAFSAAQAYRRKYRIKPNPADVARAVELYRVYLGKRSSGGRVADAADALAEMQHELDKLIAAGVQVSPELAKEHTRISINVTFGKDTPNRAMSEVEEQRREMPATNVRALLDGAPVKTLSFINVAPGSHTIVVTADGYFPGETRVAVPQGATRIADVQLQPLPAKVNVDSESGARVSVNGRLAGNLPMPPLELPAGKHVVTVAMRGREPIANELVVGRGQEITLRAPLQMTWRREAVTYMFAGAGVAGVVAGVSTTFAFLRDGEARTLLADIKSRGNFDLATTERYDGLRDARDNWRMTAYISGAALIGLTGTALLFYFTDNPSTDGVRVTPVTVPAGGGAAIAGFF